MQLKNADFRDVYYQNIWEFAYVLRMTPEDVNKLTCIDCYILVMGLTQYAKAQEKANQ
jgi:hypothetical protein